MKIAFAIPVNIALGNPYHGVLQQARKQEEALIGLGHEVQWASPANQDFTKDADVVHIYNGGYGLYGCDEIRKSMRQKRRALVFSPIVDSNLSFAKYRFAAKYLNVGRRLMSSRSSIRFEALHSDVVVVRSEHEKQRVIRSFDVEPKRVVTSLNGTEIVPPARVGDFRFSDLPAEFIFHMSFYTEPRKNVVRLAEAAGKAKLPLVIAGTNGNMAIHDQIIALGKQYNNPTVTVGNVSEEEKYEFYRRCKVFALPSSHEGTGLVALEAASAGAKVVITKNGGPVDYFEKDAWYVDPDSTSSVQGALQAAWSAPVPSGIEARLRNLSWENSAKSLIVAYEKAIELSKEGL